MKTPEKPSEPMHEDELPPAWLEAADEYNRPPDTPRAEIWTALEGEIGGMPTLSLDAARSRKSRRAATWLRPAMAAAAVLVVGIGIGRMSTSNDGEPVLGPIGEGAAATSRGAEAARSPAVRTVALEHLGRSESLLNLVRVDARQGRVDREVGQWGRGLLAQTRLLLDSPAADDPALRELLEDLELILAQVAVLDQGDGVTDDRAREELEIIARGLEQREVLSRIQAVLPVRVETTMTGI
jgi:hypothetical protein